MECNGLVCHPKTFNIPCTYAETTSHRSSAEVPSQWCLPRRSAPRSDTHGRRPDTTMPRLAARLALLSTAGAMRPSSFWQLKAADLTVGAVVIPTLARRWEDRAAFRAARKRLS